MASESRGSDYITMVRQYSRQIWEGINALKALQREFNAGDYGNTLADGVGANAGIRKAEVGAVVFDTTDALIGVLDNGHAGNMQKLL